MISVNMHNPTKAEHLILYKVDNDTVEFVDEGGNIVTLFTLPHVAKAVAAAFNKAMDEPRDTLAELKGQDDE